MLSVASENFHIILVVGVVLVLVLGVAAFFCSLSDCNPL